MSTAISNAQAAERLALVTSQYTVAAALHFDYLKVIRALKGLLEHLDEVSGDTASVKEWVRANIEFAELKRADLNDYCTKKQARMDMLNNMIQNGGESNDN